jgi:3-hydroxyisobutyrate dehydrogenase-like beta-hydroxyacid dehydrogenase
MIVMHSPHERQALALPTSGGSSGAVKVLRVAVLGLGEAGSRLAADLAAAGCQVAGWDPARPEASVGSDLEAVAGAELVLSVNSAAVALAVARAVAASLPAGSLYADLNTAPPSLKRELADALPAEFADVALLGVVPATGLGTPALVSGAGALRFARLLAPLGMPIEVVEDAAGSKLRRSVFMKGVAAAAIESLAAAEAADDAARMRAEIAAVIGEPLLERFLDGSQRHAVRRAEEMRAAASHLESLGVPPRIASAAADWLAELASKRE